MLLSLIAAVVAAVFLMIYNITRKTLFTIEFAGGIIGYDVKILNQNESLNFQRQIHLIKEKRRKELK